VAEKTKIPWADHTFNVAWGCVKISDGCEHCYADVFSRRIGLGLWGLNASRRTFGDKHWREPLNWDYQAGLEDRRHRVFCSSMTDWCLDDPTIATERLRMWALIRETPNLDWLLLTKRADSIEQFLPVNWGDGYPNVWLGVSVENRKHGLPRVDILRTIPATVRFLSVEPLLEDLGDFDLGGIHWVIVGGESGPKFRPMDHNWARAIRDRCVAARVPFFFKQSSAIRPDKGTTLDGETIRQFPITIRRSKRDLQPNV
jgi:protein gp37